MHNPIPWLVSWLIFSAAYAVVGLIVSTALWMVVESRRVLVAAWTAALLFTAIGLIAVYASPGDYQQGQWVRLMDFHVPAALLALLAYSVILGSSVREVIFRHKLAGATAKVSAPIGGAFMLVALVTGAIWGEHIWGVIGCGRTHA